MIDLTFTMREPFLNRERAQRILKEEGLDALVLSRGTNVFYATNFFPLLERMSFTATTLAVIAQDTKKPVALLIPSFSYYYIQADEGLLPDVQAYVFTSPDTAYAQKESPIAMAPLYYQLDGVDKPPPREQRRRDALKAAAPYTADLTQALMKSLKDLGLSTGRIGYDDPIVAELLESAAPKASLKIAENTLRAIRLVRTPPEIRMMRIAAQNNVDAALATISAARELGSLRAIRQRFYTEVAHRGNLGVFMVVDGVSSDAYDEPLKEGRAFLIDCVSHCRNFHADYGRTIFVGEPSTRMRYCTEAMSKTWEELQKKIRPGVKFSEVSQLGNIILKKFGFKVPIFFSPHSVGYAHSDQPRTSPNGEKIDIVIEENMILSIDCPLFETGVSGTAHLEDLVLVNAQGAEAIHTTGTPTYTI
ncbi:MAG: aminopeptidase P family protein [Gammaproteobacteria bacterium]|nr:aminopeptidase P family protein [Gammaproteobacteria bacterium]